MGSNPVSLIGGFQEQGSGKPFFIMDTILLASGSPRRREILEQYGFPLVVRPTDTDETLRNHLPVGDRVTALALDKARAALADSRDGDPRWVLSADTLVSVDGRVLGKPRDQDEARTFLRSLSGVPHRVSTGLAFTDRNSGAVRTILEETEVVFAELSDDEIEGYLDTGEWEGAAGAYRIQGRAAFLVERVIGSWSCVVGLPLRAFYVILRDSGYPLGDRPERP